MYCFLSVTLCLKFGKECTPQLHTLSDSRLALQTPHTDQYCFVRIPLNEIPIPPPRPLRRPVVQHEFRRPVVRHLSPENLRKLRAVLPACIHEFRARRHQIQAFCADAEIFRELPINVNFAVAYRHALKYSAVRGTPKNGWHDESTDRFWSVEGMPIGMPTTCIEAFGPGTTHLSLSY